MLYKIPQNRKQTLLTSTSTTPSGTNSGVGTPVGGDLGVTFGKDAVVQFTREWFARVLVDEALFEAFGGFVELEHCSENILFYKELALLEDLAASCTPASSLTDASEYESARSAGATQVLARFLKATPSGATTTQTATTTTSSITTVQPATTILTTLPPLPASQKVPAKLVQIYIDFCKFFFLPGSTHEVNVTASTRRKILSCVMPKEGEESGGGGDVQQGGEFDIRVFDAAADEVLELLYKDTFKRFVSVRSKQQQQNVSLSSSVSSKGAGAGGPAEQVEKAMTTAASSIASMFPNMIRSKSKTEGTGFRSSSESLTPVPTEPLPVTATASSSSSAAIASSATATATESSNIDSPPSTPKPSRPFWKRAKDPLLSKSKSSSLMDDASSHYPSPSTSPSPSSSPSTSRQNSTTGSSSNGGYTLPQLPIGSSPLSSSGGGGGGGGELMISSFDTNAIMMPTPAPRVVGSRKKSIFSSSSSLGGGGSRPTSPKPPLPENLLEKGAGSSSSSLKNFLLMGGGGGGGGSGGSSLSDSAAEGNQHQLGGEGGREGLEKVQQGEKKEWIPPVPPLPVEHLLRRKGSPALHSSSHESLNSSSSSSGGGGEPRTSLTGDGSYELAASEGSSSGFGGEIGVGSKTKSSKSKWGFFK
ncbi:hypothetical protein HDV05_003854 [Chytridiales sp. JEL 0842]|nr:hypothetical protein HDV05_003854 [Chytridiales sp. JEL 0842]